MRRGEPVPILAALPVVRAVYASCAKSSPSRATSASNIVASSRTSSKYRLDGSWRDSSPDPSRSANRIAVACRAGCTSPDIRSYIARSPRDSIDSSVGRMPWLVIPIDPIRLPSVSRSTNIRYSTRYDGASSKSM